MGHPAGKNIMTDYMPLCINLSVTDPQYTEVDHECPEGK